MLINTINLENIFCTVYVRTVTFCEKHNYSTVPVPG